MTEQVFAGSAELLAGASGLYCHLARSYGFGWRGGLRSKYYDAKNFRIAFVLVRQQGNLWLHGVASSATPVPPSSSPLLLSKGDFSPKADLDGDGAITLLDVGPFVALLTGG